MNNQRGSIGGLDFIFAGFPQFACQTDQWGSRWFDRGHLRVSHRLGQDSPAEPAEWISPLHQHVRAPPKFDLQVVHRRALIVAPGCVAGPIALLRPSGQRGTLGCTGVGFRQHQDTHRVSCSLSPLLPLFYPLRSGGELNTGHARESHQTGRQRLLQTSPL